MTGRQLTYFILQHADGQPGSGDVVASTRLHQQSRRGPCTRGDRASSWTSWTIGLAAAAILTTSAVGCASAPSAPTLRHPTMTLNFSELSEDERVILEKRLAEAPDFRLSCQPKGDLLKCEPGMTDKEWTPNEIFDFANAVHRYVASSTNLSGGLLAHNQSVNIELNYTNTNAQSVTGAVIFITPTPAGAQLFIDSKIPGLNRYRTGNGNVTLNDEGQFSLNLPFSYIRQKRYIYFRSVYQDATRYFYYDLDREQQFEVGGIRNADDWRQYQQSH